MNRLLRAVLRPVRPLARPFMRRLHARVVIWVHQTTDLRFEHLEQRIGGVQASVAGLERYVPALLNAIASENAANRANVRTEAELSRLVSSVLDEFQRVRNELIGARLDELDPVFEAKVLRPDALERERISLHLGSGAPEPGYLRVDTQPFDGTDVLAHPAGLPFESDSVAEIRAVHLLDRFSLEETRGTLLPHWVRLLEPCGSITVVVPDAEALVRAYVAGGLSFDELRDATFGRSTADPGARFTMFSRASLVDLLSESGLEDIELRADPTGSTSDLVVVGRKPGRATD